MFVGEIILVETANSTPAMIALDGKREICIHSGERLSVRINPAGPWVVDIEKVMDSGC
jgi:hypothetical protein